jgi:Mur ligase middle domain
VPAGFLSTVAFDRGAGTEDNLSGVTTLTAPDVQAALAGMVAAGKQAAVIETTSHALTQGRVSACEFDVAAFTNVGHDHLDYHAGWGEYVEAKGRPIDLCAEGWSKGVARSPGTTASRPPTLSGSWAGPAERVLSRCRPSCRWARGRTTWRRTG